MKNRHSFLACIVPWRSVPLVLASVLCTSLYAPFDRAIWIDEFLHFAFASFDTTADAWAAIKRSASNVNHGQTGIYMLVNYWTLKYFGADLLYLRAPSLVSGVLLCYFSGTLLKIRGFGLVWQVFAVFIVSCQVELMYYAGEARPYMPLATATMGTLVYYLASEQQRASLELKIIGVFSVTLGVLMHPYFSLYWLAIALFGFCLSWFEGKTELNAKGLLRGINLPLCVFGSIIYFIVASQTWLTGSPSFDRNPFHFMPQAELPRLIIWQHATFMGSYEAGVKLLFFASLTSLGFVFCRKKLQINIKPVIAATLLIWLALGLTVLLSLLSFYQNYWILTRQWLASIALVSIGFVWFAAEFLKIIIGFLPRLLRQISEALFFLLLALYCWQNNQSNLSARWNELAAHLKRPEAVQQTDRQPTMVTCPIDPHLWVEFANRNIKAGGPVWPIFQYYYSSKDNPYCSK